MKIIFYVFLKIIKCQFVNIMIDLTKKKKKIEIKKLKIRSLTDRKPMRNSKLYN